MTEEAGRTQCTTNGKNHGSPAAPNGDHITLSVVNWVFKVRVLDPIP